MLKIFVNNNGINPIKADQFEKDFRAIVENSQFLDDKLQPLSKAIRQFPDG